MQKNSEKEFYDRFHKRSMVPTKVVDSSDFVYRNILRSLRLLEIKDSDSFLDYGCGNGVLAYYLAKEYKCHVTGIDISEEAISRAMESSLYDKLDVSFIAGDITEMSIQERFEKIMCVEVIEHVDDDSMLLERFSEVLKDGGILLLTTQLKSAPLHRLRVKLFGVDSFDSRVGHRRRYSIRELIDLLHSRNFQVVKILKAEGVLRNWMFTTATGQRAMRLFKKAGLLAMIHFLDSHLFRHLGESQIIVVAKKRPNVD